MRARFAMAFGMTMLAALCVGKPSDPWIRGITDRNPVSYGIGDEMTFTLTLENGDGKGREIVWRRTGDDGRVEEGRAPATAPVVVKTSLDRSGFVRVYAELVAPGGRLVGYVGRHVPKGVIFFDGGAGAAVGDIRLGVAEPADFDAFWARHRATLAAVAMRDVCVKEHPSANPLVRIFAVSVPCAGGKPSTGYLLVPAKGGAYPARVQFYGYAASWSPKAAAAPDGRDAKANEIALRLSAHGFELNREAAYYAELQRLAGSNGHGHAFDPVQNADPETAYFCGMTYRILRGLEYLKSRPEWNGRDLAVEGSSQGGLQAIWAAALDGRVTSCRIEVPWCCDVGGSVVGRNRGSWHLAWAPGLGYYDAVNMARRIPKTCRVDVYRAGLGDYTCPPSGVAAFYQALACPKRIVWWQGSTHFVRPPEPQKFVNEEN